MPPENCIGLEIRNLSNLIRRDVEKHADELEFKPNKGVRGWAIDYFYENRDKDIYQKDFEEKFSIRRSTASNILKLMEKNGFITRQSTTTVIRSFLRKAFPGKRWSNSSATKSPIHREKDNMPLRLKVIPKIT